MESVLDQLIAAVVFEQMKQFEDGLKSATEETDKLVAAVDKLTASAKNAKSLAELQKIFQAQAQIEEKLNKVEVERASLLKKAEETTQRTIAMRSKEAIELERVRQEYAKTKKELSNYVKESKAAEGSLVEMRAKLSKLTLEYDNLSKSVRNSKFGRDAAKDIKALSDELKVLEAETGRNQRNVGNYFESIKKGLANIAGALGIVTGVRLLINVFKSGYSTIVDFEQANANLASILGVTSDEVVILTDDAKRLGEATEYSASQVTGLQTELAKLGFNQDQIIDMTESILKFATAAGANLSDAASLSGASLRAFGLESKDTERVVAAMAAGLNKTALDFGYLNTAMSTIAPVANAFNFSIEDTVALLGQLANSGFDASSAATATRNILLNLADANGALAKELGGPVKSLEDLAAGLQELKSRNVDLATTLELTDKRSVAAFNTFIQGAGSLVELRDSVTNAGAALTKMQQTQLDTVQGATKLLQSAWEGLMLSFSGSTGIFKSLINILTSFVGVLNSLVNLFSKYAGVVKTVTVAVVTYIASVKLSVLWTKNEAGATVLSTVALKAKTAAMKLATTASWLWSAAISLLTGNIKGATYAFKIFTTAIKASPIGLLAAGAAAVVTGLMALRKETKSTEEVISDLGTATENYVQSGKKVADLAREYETLKGKTERTKEENERLDTIMNQLAQTIPGVVTQFDEYGRALDINIEKVKAYSTEQKEAAELALKHQIEEGRKQVKELDRQIKEQQLIYQKGIKTVFGNWGAMANDEDRGAAATKANELFAQQAKLIESIANAEKELQGIRESGSNAGITGAVSEKDAITVAKRIQEIRDQIVKTNNDLKKLREGDEILNIDEIKKSEQTLKDLGSELELLIGKQEKAKKATDDSAKIAERLAKAQSDLINLRLQEQLDGFKKIADDEKNSYSIRMDAAKEYENARKDQIKNTADGELKILEINLAEEKKKYAGQKDVLSNLEKTYASQILVVGQKKNNELNKAEQDAVSQREKMAQDEVKRLTEVYTKLVDQRKKAIDNQESQDVADLNPKSFRNFEKYEKAKADIQKKYAMERQNVEIDVIKEQINAYKKLADSTEVTEEQRKTILEKSAELEINLIGLVLKARIAANEAAAKDTKSTYDIVSEFIKEHQIEYDAIMNAWQTLTDIGAEISRRNIERIDAEIDAINKKKDAELDALDKSVATDEVKAREKERIEQRAAAQTANLERRKRQEQIKQANWEKAWALSQVAISTATAIMKAWELGFPAAIPIIALVGATGIAQAAMIASQPIPAYEKGTGSKDHPGGPALVGEKRHEAIILPSGEILKSPNAPTVLDLPKHTVVKPDYNTYVAKMIDKQAKGINGIEQIDKVNRDLLLDEVRAMKRELQSRNPDSVHVSVDDSHLWRITRKRGTNVKIINDSLTYERRSSKF